MPVEHAKRQPSVHRKIYDKLKNLVNLHPTGLSVVSRYSVLNPHPNLFTVRWSTPKNVGRKKRMYGAEVVTAERAREIYKIPDDDIDKGKNCVLRDGQILLEYPTEANELRSHLGMFRDLQMTTTEIDTFYNSKDVEARQLDADGRPVRVNGHNNRREVQVPRRNAFEKAAKMAEQTENEAQSGVKLVDGVKVIETELD